MWAWPGSRDRDNSTVQTAAMGQIPRSAEHILVEQEIGCSMAMKKYGLEPCTKHLFMVSQLSLVQ